MMKFKYILPLLLALFMTSCEFEDLLNDPNNITPDQADNAFILNSIEFGLNEYFFELTDYSMEIVRMTAAQPRGASYETAWQPQDFDDMWELAYVGVLSDCNSLVAKAEQTGQWIHSGIAKTIQAYTLMTQTDFFAKTTWSEAFNADIFNPTLDDGAAVYDAALVLLNAAIDDFGKDVISVPTNDQFYGGDAASWTRLANTLKLRLYLTTRLTNSGSAAAISDLISGGELISAGQDWEFPFSTNATSPDNRHPYFGDNYVNGANDYMANYFMDLLIRNQSITDPRLRYYFFRQVDAITMDVNELNCIAETVPAHYTADMPWCHVGEGYWGRDHLDTDGIPPDNLLRTVFGLYPCGGKYDDNSLSAGASSGAQGAGVHPMMLASWVDFMLAESALTLGTAGDPAALLESGIRGHIAKVMAFGGGATDVDLEPTAEDVDAYVSAVMEGYNAGNDAEKLDVIMTEYYIALWGNGIEAYNLYRRTSSPSSIQFALNDNPGTFVYSFPYPSNVINRNTSVSSKGTVGVKVFWDTNPDDLK